jgi:hypothetical protein
MTCGAIRLITYFYLPMSAHIILWLVKYMLWLEEDE